MSIGKKLLELRKSNNMTQEQFAAKYHVTRQTVSNWENDKHYPDMELLKEIADEYGITFDELFKDDDRYIKTVDSTVKRMSILKKIFLILLIVIVGLTAGLVYIFHNAFEATPDGERILTDTDVKLLTCLKDSDPSFAITRTYDEAAFNSFSKKKKMSLRSETAGRLEGDIPCVSIEKRSNSRVTFRFQDDMYRDIKTKIKDIILYTAPGMPVEPERRDDKKLKYEYKDGIASVYLSDVLEKNELTFTDYEYIEPKEPQVWFCIFEIHFTYKNKSYVSLTSVAV